MIRLSREIRFALVAPDQVGEIATGNSWAGWPATNRVVPQLVLRCEVSGDPDPRTGYLCNIKLIDNLLRDIVRERLIPEYDGQQTAESMIRTAFEHAIANCDLDARLESITLVLNPYLSFCIEARNFAMIQLTQQFEFSAAHRLHAADLSDTENAAYFGKCNNPEGHGHNYVVEVTVARATTPTVSDESEQIMPLAELEATVKKLVIDPFDHKHLNRDVEFFSTVNPTVENIAITIYDRLHGQFGAAKLQKIRVYETPKTWAEYSGE